MDLLGGREFRFDRSRSTFFSKVSRECFKFF